MTIERNIFEEKESITVEIKLIETPSINYETPDKQNKTNRPPPTPKGNGNPLVRFHLFKMEFMSFNMYMCISRRPYNEIF